MKVRTEPNGFADEKEEHGYDGMQEMGDEGGEGEEEGHDEMETGGDGHMHEDDGEHGGEGERRPHSLADYLRISDCY